MVDALQFYPPILPAAQLDFPHRRQRFNRRNIKQANGLTHVKAKQPLNLLMLNLSRVCNHVTPTPQRVCAEKNLP